MKRQRESEDEHGIIPTGKLLKANVPNTRLQSAPEELPQLLDLSSLTSHAIISARFEAIASALLRDYRIVLTCGDTETTYEIIELEFYLQKQGCHEDPFTHGSEEQKISGCWYFHRAPRRSAKLHNSAQPGYRGGSRKGLDLTFGSPIAVPSSAAVTSNLLTHAVRGGILLRTFRRATDQKVISGPSLLVDEILRASSAHSIHDLVYNKWRRDISAFPPVSPVNLGGSEASPLVSLYLRRSSTTQNLLQPQVFCSPRVGLDLSHPEATDSLTHPRVVFVSKPYRFFIHPTLLTNNGRAHTFLGVYEFSLRASPHKPKIGLIGDVARLSGIGQQTVTRYLESYRDGLANGALKPFVGRSNKGTSSSPATFLRLMGTLRRLQQQ